MNKLIGKSQILLAIFFSFMVSQLWASQQLLREGHPERYVVEEGDTLWGISEKFLNSPWNWPEIWHANDQIENPHLIYPGDELNLVYVDGKPRLTIKRRGNVVKLSPNVRAKPLKSRIPLIPLDMVKSFLVDNRVVTSEELEAAPYVVAGGEQHIIMGQGDTIYARGEFNELASSYGFFRQGGAYQDPDTGEFLGVQAVDLGTGKTVKLEEDIATLEVISSKEDIRVNDKLLPTEDRKVDSVFYPKSPDVEIEGKIIHVFSGVRNVSQYNVVVLNRGDRDQLQVGDVLAVYRQGEKVRDRKTQELIRLPEERAGLLIVFRTFEKVSFGLILKAQGILRVLDAVRNPT